MVFTKKNCSKKKLIYSIILRKKELDLGTVIKGGVKTIRIPESEFIDNTDLLEVAFAGCISILFFCQKINTMINFECARAQIVTYKSMKDKFLKITAHDLKNPFNSIMGFSELLRRKIKNTSKDKIQKMVNIILF